MKKILLLIGFLTITMVFGSGFRKQFSEHKLQFGTDASALRELIFDYTEDANSAKITVDPATEKLNFQAQAIFPETVTINDSLIATDITASQIIVTSTQQASHFWPSMTNTVRDTLSANEGDCIWSTTDKVGYCYSNGAWNDIGSGGSGGLDIYFQDDYERTLLTDWTASQDATFLGTGATLNGTFGTTQDVINGRSFYYTMGASSTNDWLASAPITLTKKQCDGSPFNAIKINYKYDGSDGDIRLVVWDVTNSKLLTSTLDIVKGRGSPTDFIVSFYPTDCSSTSPITIKYGFHVVTGNSGKVLHWDDTEISTNPFVYKNLIETASVRAEGNGGTSITANTTNIDFTEVSDSNGAWNGTQYSVQNSNSIVKLSGSIQATASTINSFELYKNGTLYKRISEGDTSSNGQWHIEFTSSRGEFLAEDLLSIRAIVGFTLNNDVRYHYLSINEQWESESVITPIEAGSEVLRLGNALGYGSTATKIPYFNDVEEDTSNKLFSYSNDSTNGVQITALRDIIIDASFDFTYTTQSNAGFSVEGTSTTNLVWIAQANRISIASSTSNVGATTGGETVLRQGEVLRPHTDGTTIASGSYWKVRVTARPITATAVGAIPVPEIAFVNVDATNVRGQKAATIAYKTWAHTSIEGDSSWLSTASSQLSISPGKYLIEWEVGCYGGALNLDTKLLDVSTGAHTREFLGAAHSAVNAISSAKMHHTLELTKLTKFEFQTKSQVGTGLEYVWRIKVTRIKEL